MIKQLWRDIYYFVNFISAFKSMIIHCLILELEKYDNIFFSIRIISQHLPICEKLYCFPNFTPDGSIK